MYNIYYILYRYIILGILYRNTFFFRIIEDRGEYRDLHYSSPGTHRLLTETNSYLLHLYSLCPRNLADYMHPPGGRPRGGGLQSK